MDENIYIEENYKGFEKVKESRDFLVSIGFKVKKELPQIWNLDTCVILVPELGAHEITFRGFERYIMKVNIYVAGGIHLELSGKFGTLNQPYETVPTDYNFNCQYEDYKFQFFRQEIRARKLKDLFNK